MILYYVITAQLVMERFPILLLLLSSAVVCLIATEELEEESTTSSSSMLALRIWVIIIQLKDAIRWLCGGIAIKELYGPPFPSSDRSFMLLGWCQSNLWSTSRNWWKFNGTHSFLNECPGESNKNNHRHSRGGEIACNLLQEHFILIKSLLREITREFNTLLVLLLVIILLEITDLLLFTWI